MVRSGDEEGGKKRSRQGLLNGENGLNHLSLSFLGISRLFSVASSSVSSKLVRIFLWEISLSGGRSKKSFLSDAPPLGSKTSSLSEKVAFPFFKKIS